LDVDSEVFSFIAIPQERRRLTIWYLGNKMKKYLSKRVFEARVPRDSLL